MSSDIETIGPPTPPKLGVFYHNGVPSYTCMTCDVALGDAQTANDHLLSVHAATGTKHYKHTLGFACGRPSQSRSKKKY